MPSSRDSGNGQLSCTPSSQAMAPVDFWEVRHMAWDLGPNRVSSAEQAHLTGLWAHMKYWHLAPFLELWVKRSGVGPEHPSG